MSNLTGTITKTTTGWNFQIETLGYGILSCVEAVKKENVIKQMKNLKVGQSLKLNQNKLNS